MEMSRDSMDLFAKSYRDKALDTFVRSLNGDLPRLLGFREPDDDDDEPDDRLSSYVRL